MSGPSRCHLYETKAQGSVSPCWPEGTISGSKHMLSQDLCKAPRATLDYLVGALTSPPLPGRQALAFWAEVGLAITVWCLGACWEYNVLLLTPCAAVGKVEARSYGVSARCGC